MKNIKELVNELIGKVNSTTNNYQEALEKKHAELLELQVKLESEQEKEKHYFKMFIQKDITDETFKEQKQVTDELKNKIASIQNEMNLIETYRTEDTDKIVEELNKSKKTLNIKQQEEITKVKKELAEAKQQYLKQLEIVGQSYEKAVSENKKLENVLVKFNYQRNFYTPDIFEILGTGAVVGTEEARKYLG